MFRRILVVVDGGPSDLDVLREAAGLALLSNADLTLLAVVPPYTDIDTGYALPTMVDERLEQTCRTALAVAHSVVPPTIAARCMLRHGDPVGVILAEISGHGHDAVVTGPAGGALIRLSPVLVVVVHDAERAGRAISAN